MRQDVRVGRRCMGRRQMHAKMGVDAMRHFTCAVLLLVAVVGCATQKEIFLPSGEKGYSIACGGNASSWNDCLSKAGDTCGSSGYEIISQISERKNSAIATGRVVSGGPYTDRTMIIKCN